MGWRGKSIWNCVDSGNDLLGSEFNLTTQSLTQFSTPSESNAYLRGTQFSPPSESNAYLRGISASKVSLGSLSAGIGNYLISKTSSVFLFFIDVFRV